MERANKLKEYQIKRDKLNEEIEKQFNTIVLEGYTLEEKKVASVKHEELIKEYLELAQDLKELNKNIL